jgi:hypothetical protein
MRTIKSKSGKIFGILQSLSIPNPDGKPSTELLQGYQEWELEIGEGVTGIAADQLMASSTSWEKFGGVYLFRICETSGIAAGSWGS